MFGRKITSKRKVAWYGEKPFKYTYSNTTKQALPWTKELLKLNLKQQLKLRRAKLIIPVCSIYIIVEMKEWGGIVITNQT